MPIDRRTYVQQAYAHIRSMVLEGTLKPGTKVVVRELSEHLNLSATPIKAALAALERDGFLTAIAHRGYFVTRVSVKDMREIYELREVLDGIAARNAAVRIDCAQWVTEVLRPLHARQQKCVLVGDAAGYSDADLEFHRSIWYASENVRLAQVADNLVGQIRFGSGSSSTLPGRVQQALGEHRVIMDALEAGDATRAEHESREHVRRSAAAFEQATTVDA
jgi:DNA-binding GntR family transcriptional regulator